MIELFLIHLLLTPLTWMRWVLSLRPHTYALLMLPQAQPLLEAIARLRLRALFLKASNDCPAYREFLREQGWTGRHPWRFTDLPLTTKENYVKRWPLEARCFRGRLDGRGDVIDESSGSSGMPNNWVRNARERAETRRILQLSYGLLYGDPGRVLLNCFALGPWATGMNVSMSLAEVGILKSIGPDAAKLENTLRLFGPRYRYLVFGYPPFLKAFVDGSALDLSAYTIDTVVGGEGMSEGLRDYLRKHFRTVVSAYGASDLEINVAVETDWTIALRKRCAADRELCCELFGRDTPPMIFQYNALDYHVESTAEGEMVFTICRDSGASPKIRYDLKDLGGAWRFRDLARKLAARGIAPRDLAARFGCLPILYVYGRADLTAAFYGAKVYPADFEATILGDARLAPAVASFQFAVVEDERLDRRLAIDLEQVRDGAPPPVDARELSAIFHRGLAASNQDFREVSRLFDAGAIVVTLHASGTGPFAGADVRIKRQYVRPTP